MLTSFGVVQQARRKQSIFLDMPPVSMNVIDKVFIPEYPALLLCEKIILDETSYAYLESSPPRAYDLVADTVKKLHSEGFIELVDFKDILNRNVALLDKMVQNDLKMLDYWIEPLRESFETWRRFSTRLWKIMREVYNIPQSYDVDDLWRELHIIAPKAISFDKLVRGAFDSSRKRKKSKYRNVLREVVRLYLSYVNANIVLSNELGVGFHDWADFSPFYRLKFLAVGREDHEAQHQISHSAKLFEISFPEFSIKDTASLIKAIKDKRIERLRKLVQEAVEGRVTFDERFAHDTLQAVLGIEREINRYRKITSYLTMPIGFVPWIGIPLQKAIEEALSTHMEHKLKKEYRWFYLLSDVAMERKNRDNGIFT